MEELIISILSFKNNDKDSLIGQTIYELNKLNVQKLHEFYLQLMLENRDKEERQIGAKLRWVHN